MSYDKILVAKRIADEDSFTMQAEIAHKIQKQSQVCQVLPAVEQIEPEFKIILYRNKFPNGVTLQSEMDNNIGGRTIAEKKMICEKLLEALDILHTRCRLYHGDIKPSNILVSIPAEEFDDKDQIQIQFIDLGSMGGASQKKSTLRGTTHSYIPIIRSLDPKDWHQQEKSRVFTKLFLFDERKILDRYAMTMILIKILFNSEDVNQISPRLKIYQQSGTDLIHRIKIYQKEGTDLIQTIIQSDLKHKMLLNPQTLSAEQSDSGGSGRRNKRATQAAAAGGGLQSGSGKSGRPRRQGQKSS